jgi:F-type H+-transporting ATPase subunit delta|mmetsp:Transcript_41635/g.70756  ORF Transcript_41635/g.70756 Transcript_41635/m.70756 type:complete len:188 (+) Transcript_41635:1432-1995(+)
MTSKILATKIAEPYASALLDLAVSTHTVDFVTTDINDLLKIFQTNGELTNYLNNPLYPKSSKKNILQKLIDTESSNQNTKHFLMILVDRSRINLFETIAEKYLQLVYDLAEIKKANVTSAFKLDPEQELEIVAQLKKRTNAKEIKLVSTIDKSLLGGLQVQIGSNIIDVSLKGQLRQLATQLETTLF